MLTEKKEKRKGISEHRTCANCRQKPHPQNLNRRQYAQVQPFDDIKKIAPFFD
jgi:hypothetical protein